MGCQLSRSTSAEGVDTEPKHTPPPNTPPRHGLFAFTKRRKRKTSLETNELNEDTATKLGEERIALVPEAANDKNGDASAPSATGTGAAGPVVVGQPPDNVHVNVNMSHPVSMDNGAMCQESLNHSDNQSADRSANIDQIHKNFQERLLTAGVANQKQVNESQAEFFRALDAKIAQGAAERKLSQWKLQQQQQQPHN